jgi:hypothetical protein
MQHTEFSKALNATGRPIWLELCRGYKYDKGQIPSYVAEVIWREGGWIFPSVERGGLRNVALQNETR